MTSFASVKKVCQIFKKHYLWLLTAILLTEILLATPVQSITIGSESVNSYGTINYEDQTLLLAIQTNYSNLIIPNDFPDVGKWSYISLDYNVYHTSAPSICLSSDYDRGTRECNTKWFNLNPGDHVVWSVWCRTDGDNSDNTQYTGGRIGLDLYGSYEVKETGQKVRIVDSLPRDYVFIDGMWCSGTSHSYCRKWSYPENDVYPDFGTPNTTQFQVPWGTNKWTLIYWDFVVPDTTYYFVDGHPPTQIIGCIPWLDARQLTENHAWFVDASFYINGEEVK